MNLGFLWGRRGTAVAIDVGTDAIKVVRLGGAARVEAASLVRLPDRFHPAGLSPEESPDIRSCLREALERAGVRSGSTRTIVTGIGGPAIRIRQVELPSMPDEEVASALQFEAKKHIPFDINDVILDFQILERADAKGGTTILLAAAQKEAVRRRAELMKSVDLEPTIVDVSPLAEMNYLGSMGLAAPEASVGYLDLAASAFGLSIWRPGGLFLHRYLAGSGRQWTRAVADASGLRPDEAEELGAEGGKEAEVLRWLAPSIEQLVQEIRQSVSFYGTRGGRHGLSALYAGGGLALLPGLAEHLSKLLGFPVEKPRTPAPGDGVSGEPELGVRFVTALGLATRVSG